MRSALKRNPHIFSTTAMNRSRPRVRLPTKSYKLLRSTMKAGLSQLENPATPYEAHGMAAPGAWRHGAFPYPFQMNLVDLS